MLKFDCSLLEFVFTEQPIRLWSLVNANDVVKNEARLNAVSRNKILDCWLCFGGQNKTAFDSSSFIPPSDSVEWNSCPLRTLERLPLVLWAGVVNANDSDASSISNDFDGVIDDIALL